MLSREEMEFHHLENPHIYEEFENFAFQAISSGRKYFGAGAVFERLRWYSQIETKGDQFKLNNNYRAFYARLFEEKNPEYKGFFRKRRSVADEK